MSNINEKKRIKEIVSVFVKHGIKKGIMNPQNARAALEELGPTFVKIGQILSTRPDILPDEYIVEFEKLQDNVKPEKYDDIKKILEKALGESIENLFSYFKEKPIASASMAQVHLACTKNGEEVVVKIQRPNVKEIMMSDIALLKRLTKIGKLVPQKSVIDFKEVVEEIGTTMEKELDFLNEAENIEKFYKYNKGVKYIACPKVYKEYTTSSILTMEYIKGIKVNNIDDLKKEGYSLKAIAKKLMSNYVKQIFQDGFFHADPHPGNLLIHNKKIAYIDFGMMGVLDKSMRNKLNDLLYAAAKRDMEGLTHAVLRIGIKKGKVNIRNLYSDIEEVYNRYVQESLQNIDLPQFVDEMFQVSKKNNLAMPNNMALFLKGIMTIEGVVAKLDPDMNMMEVAVPYIKEHIILKKNYKQDIIEQIENIYQLSKYGLKIPIKTLELMNSVLAGKLKVQIEHKNLEESIYQLNKMTNRIVFSLIISSIVVGSSLVINANVGPKIYDISFFGLIGYLSAAVMGLWLLILILKNEKM
ncbi:ABC1 kinase family protein [Crassaminicella indica]|uniref:AarF/ABC1/UbiB kinase family protein n=1 Tax=Crassaminicella indica TaxID=2855394 RepID=A0ABX8RDJ3_9CLOT|nr:AarF/ABC1/UbiB kinase family protein [Crassaminicella indica]QXM07137.1 AarF/ABC1/UbiB kinase family protein [Crassaminicella indica]